MNDKPIRHGRFRLIVKGERWGFTIWGWAVVAIVACAVVLVLVTGINGWLAIDCPLGGELLVVEGWLPDYAIPGAISEFKRIGYKLMIAVGGPIEVGSHLSEFKSYAELTQARLIALGFDEKRLVVLDTGNIKKDRTYGSAKAVRQWAALNRVRVQGLDVYTLGAHARRSRLLFEKAFGKDVAIGVFASPDDHSYDPKSWWKCSEGARTVVGELIAYLYALIFFHP